jgi:hypothetical protein
MMEPGKREALRGEVAQAIEEHGEPFEVDYESHLYIARRAERG